MVLRSGSKDPIVPGNSSFEKQGKERQKRRHGPSNVVAHDDDYAAGWASLKHQQRPNSKMTILTIEDWFKHRTRNDSLIKQEYLLCK